MQFFSRLFLQSRGIIVNGRWLSTGNFFVSARIIRISCCLDLPSSQPIPIISIDAKPSATKTLISGHWQEKTGNCFSRKNEFTVCRLTDKQRSRCVSLTKRGGGRARCLMARAIRLKSLDFNGVGRRKHAPQCINSSSKISDAGGYTAVSHKRRMSCPTAHPTPNKG